MRFTPTTLEGLVIIDLVPIEDERGFFARSYCAHEFEDARLPSTFCQCNVSFNRARGTLRGMHFQGAPHEEGKLVRCSAGAIYDVAVDLRPDSSSYTRWESFELTSKNRRALYIPPGFAHGFQSLVPDTEVFYQMTTFFVPGFSRGVRWDDPAFKISWPISEMVISERDQSYPDFDPHTFSRSVPERTAGPR